MPQEPPEYDPQFIVDPCPAPPTTFTSWPTQAELLGFNEWMAGLGPRFAGTPPHDCLVDQIKTALQPLVAAGTLTPDPIPPTAFDKWEASTATLTLASGPNAGQAIPVAGYMPFCEHTAGVTAPLVFEKPSWLAELLPFPFGLVPLKFKASKHSDRIVAVRLRSVELPKWLLKFLSRNSISDFSNWAPYERTITLEMQAPCLNKAKAAGALGVIVVLDMSSDHAEKQYLPFARPEATLAQGVVPGIHVDCDQRATLKAHAAANGNVTLTVSGAVTPGSTTEHLLYTLPGADAGTPNEEIILVQTHTDGPGALEENGVMALLALIQHFAGVPVAQRPRTLKFLFATGHFVPSIEGAKDLFWPKHPPEVPIPGFNPPTWLPQAKASVAIEHLGSKEWVDDCQAGYVARPGPGGVTHDEPALVFVTGGKHPLEALADNHLPDARRIVLPSRKRMMIFKRKFFGEGQYVHCTGVPTLGYVPNPNYMFSYADPAAPAQLGHVEKLDPARALTELDAFRNLIDELVSDPLAGWPTVVPDATQCKTPKNSCD